MSELLFNVISRGRIMAFFMGKILLLLKLLCFYWERSDFYNKKGMVIAYQLISNLESELIMPYNIFRECSIDNENEEMINFPTFGNIYMLNDKRNIFLLNQEICKNEQINHGQSYISGSINISDCFFVRSMVYSGSGGIIYVNGGLFSLNIESTMFYNCEVSTICGAIYFSSTKSILSMICANRCSAFEFYHFGSFLADQENQMYFVSISMCSHTYNGCHSIAMIIGKQILKNSNSSMNNANQYSGFLFESPITFACSYTTYSNNKVSNYTCLLFYSLNGTMLFSNIVHNNSPLGDGILKIHGGLLIIRYCVFNQNRNILFSLKSGSITVSDSYISHISIISTYSSMILGENISFISTHTYYIPFFGSFYCNTDKYSFENSMINNSIYLIISFSLVVLVTVFAFLSFRNKRIASILIKRRELEESLSIDYG